MNRYVVCVVLAILLVGCGQKEEAQTARVAYQQAIKDKEQAEKNAAIALASQEAAEEKAANLTRITFGLGIGALLAFFFGVGLGSSSRKLASAANAAKAQSD